MIIIVFVSDFNNFANTRLSPYNEHLSIKSSSSLVKNIIVTAKNPRAYYWGF
jgi:hypothetical protein